MLNSAIYFSLLRNDLKHAHICIMLLSAITDFK